MTQAKCVRFLDLEACITRCVKNCEEDKTYHTNYEGNCTLSLSLLTRLPSYALITQFSPQ